MNSANGVGIQFNTFFLANSYKYSEINENLQALHQKFLLSIFIIMTCQNFCVRMVILVGRNLFRDFQGKRIYKYFDLLKLVLPLEFDLNEKYFAAILVCIWTE